MTRQELQTSGFLAVAKSSDLHRYGWNIVHWLRVSDGAEAIEFVERWPAAGSGPRRVIVQTYADQAAFHRELGLNIVEPREAWFDAR